MELQPIVPSVPRSETFPCKTVFRRKCLNLCTYLVQCFWDSVVVTYTRSGPPLP